MYMELFKSLNLFATFILEIALFIAFGEIAFRLDAPLVLRILTAVGVIGFVIFMWAMWLAPRAAYRLELPWLVVAKAALFLLASLGLYLQGDTLSAIVLSGAFVLAETLALIWKQEQKH